MAIKLYGFGPSHCTRRVALILKEMNVPYELVSVDMLKNEHKASSFVEKQPFGQVPYIDDDGFQLFESRAIARYIVTKYASQGPSLLPDPADVQKSARFEQAASIELSNFDPYMNALAWEVIFKKYAGGSTDEAVVANLVQTLNGKVDAYELLLSKSRYLAGDEVTLADLYHLPFGSTLGLMGYDLLLNPSRPNVARWWKDISSLDPKSTRLGSRGSGVSDQLAGFAESDHSPPSPSSYLTVLRLTSNVTLINVFLAAAAVTVHETSREKLPIYPAPNTDILLLDTPSELEKQIGVARRAVTATYDDARGQVQGVISRWINVEQAVEQRLKSLVAPDEPLTPGLLYVGVATLTGSIFARNRILAARIFLPPTLLVLSFNHFLPKTATNIQGYLGSLEDTYFPTLAEKHEIANQHSAMTWERIKDATSNGRETLASSVESAIVRLEDVTGLKLKETLGWGQGVVRAAESQTKGAVQVVQQEANALTGVVAHAVEEVKEGVVAETSPIVETKVDESPKRLV
ncbi:uncharacterized protein FIBRA_08868 [Fibroporia radiculosa]|uniref:MICOS complex subunit n=1 Tax=Fibroporia radiculosa TaxID=599839 RepID=J4GXJ3_9APHY|nr:uncharacterized protein FIBRA_08868 [Fibroporia radiculosa]CCM06590.1 predicted protein [Fibroporia radiculosa]